MNLLYLGSNDVEYETKWNEMEMDKNNFIHSRQLLANAVSKSLLSNVDFVQKDMKPIYQNGRVVNTKVNPSSINISMMDSPSKKAQNVKQASSVHKQPIERSQIGGNSARAS